MTSRTGRHTGTQRGAGRLAASLVAGGALAVGLMCAAPAAPVLAEPASPTPTDSADATAADGASQMSADQALALIDKEYDTGAAGGQLSNLIHQVLKMRAQGYKASNANREAITAALDKRPNQQPLVEALEGDAGLPAQDRRPRGNCSNNSSSSLRFRFCSGCRPARTRSPRAAGSPPAATACSSRWFPSAVVDEKLLAILVCPWTGTAVAGA